MLLGLGVSTAFTQNNQFGNIHGMVTDSSGAPIPAAQVTVSSPALLAAQAAATDSGGNYRFEQLPVGAYRIVAAQPGFQQYVRDSIQISAGFSAEVNVQMIVGAQNETVTVTAESPVLDTTSTTVSASANARTVADEIPATRTMQEMVSIAPGVMPTSAPDLGGGVIASFVLSAYGITGQSTALIEGINTRKSNNNAEGDYDYTTLEEMQIVPTGGDAQTTEPGVFLNAIVKSGGNSFHGRGEVNYENQALESNNLTPLLRSQGNTAPNLILDATDASLSVGGPIMRDRWWFFGGAHVNNSHRTALGYIVNGKPGEAYGRLTNWTGKSTYQINPKYRLIGFYTREGEYFPAHFGSPTVPFLNTRDFTEPVEEYKGEFQATLSHSLVFDFFAGHHLYQADYVGQADPQNIPSMTDLTTGIANGPNLGQDHRARRQTQVTGSLSYFPAGSFLGKHEFKFGSTWMFMWTGTDEPNGIHGNYQLLFQTVGGVAGTPVQMRFFNYPIPENREDLHEGGFFVQDNWRVAKHVTINVGLRLDDFATFIPPQNKPAGAFGPPWVAPASGDPNIYTGGAQGFTRISTGTWRNVAPRVGVAWDISGHGKTVLKAAFGRYNWTPGDDFASPLNLNTTAVSTYRWNSTMTTCTEAVALQGRCDYVPGSVNLNPNGPDFQSVLGGSNGAVVKLSNAVINPQLREEYSNVFQAFVERELGPGLSARVGYTYVDNRNTWVQIPSAIPFGAWTTAYTVYDAGPTVPSCLPTATVTCNTNGPAFPVYDMAAAYKGAAFSTTQYVNKTGNGDHFGTIEATVMKRPGSGRWTVLASYTATRDHSYINTANGNNGAAPIWTNPNQLLFPLDKTWAWQGRLTGNYRLPWRFDISATYNLYNGLYGQRTESYVLPNAGSIVVPVERYGAEEGPIRALLNLRFARNFRTERWGLFRPNVELLNALNSAAPWTITYTSGPRFNYYNSTDTPRIVRVGLVYEF
jgi:Carboxypeptidase regulatory-like domain